MIKRQLPSANSNQNAYKNPSSVWNRFLNEPPMLKPTQQLNLCRYKPFLNFDYSHCTYNSFLKWDLIQFWRLSSIQLLIVPTVSRANCSGFICKKWNAKWKCSFFLSIFDFWTWNKKYGDEILGRKKICFFENMFSFIFFDWHFALSVYDIFLPRFLRLVALGKKNMF